MDWKNKAAIVTGASAGIGKATKDLLEQKGAIVYLDRNKPLKTAMREKYDV